LKKINQDAKDYVFLNYNVTTKCNQRCRYCYNLDLLQNNEDTDLKTWNIILAKIKRIYQKYANKKIIFTFLGGEPFLFKDLWQYVDDLIKIPNIFKVVITTNGSIHPEETFLKKYKEKLLLLFSYHGKFTLNEPKFITNVLSSRQILERQNTEVTLIPYQENYQLNEYIATLMIVNNVNVSMMPIIIDGQIQPFDENYQNLFERIYQYYDNDFSILSIDDKKYNLYRFYQETKFNFKNSVCYNQSYVINKDYVCHTCGIGKTYSLLNFELENISYICDRNSCTCFDELKSFKEVR
jgi:organic radical activating enzyme